MPAGLQGQRRPIDVIGNAAEVARTVIGEIKDTKLEQPAKHCNGLVRAKARVVKLTAEERSEIAQKVPAGGWG